MRRELITALGLCTLCAACGDSDEPAQRTEGDNMQTGASAPSSGCKPGKPYSAGQETVAIQSGGTERSYILYVPESYDPEAATPLIVDFHGSGATPALELAHSNMVQAAEEHGYAIALPVAAMPWVPAEPARGFTWNVPVVDDQPDDVQFAEDVIADASDKLCIDAKRVYATGYSGGGRLASQLACSLPERVAAIGSIAGLRHYAPCTQSRPVPIIAFHGTDDKVNPYDGNGAPGWEESVPDAFAAWGSQLKCSGEPKEEAVSSAVSKLSYERCKDDTPLVLYRIAGAGHTWPGTSFSYPSGPGYPAFGGITEDIDATQLQFAFFAEHVLR